VAPRSEAKDARQKDTQRGRGGPTRSPQLVESGEFGRRGAQRSLSPEEVSRNQYMGNQKSRNTKIDRTLSGSISGERGMRELIKGKGLPGERGAGGRRVVQKEAAVYEFTKGGRDE